jgi:XRE family aerobic/anaerobic benzoate catabolism transcriptional regulator
VRRHRKERGWTIKQLSEASHLSPRFLSDLEHGRGNISIGKLLHVAQALEVPLQVLVAPLDAGASLADHRKCIALVGLRGAGKSTIGRALAHELGVPFRELDDEIEAAAGLPLGQIFELHGEAYYRRLEREVLARILASERDGSVLAIGGGVVTDPESWSLLKRGARSVWLKAKPEEHYQRVMEQGDMRPMKNRPAAMAELRALLVAREPLYKESEILVDTSSLGVEGAVDRIAGWARA